MKTLLVISVLLLIVFIANRIVGAYYQCYAPPFAHSSSCFIHDVLTGEDL